MPTLTENADRAQAALELYQRAHIAMATGAETLVAMVADGTLTPAEGMHKLTVFVDRYHAALAALDGRMGT
ncbi:MAG: hypothetical protein ABSF35_24115 [Polyangia bacterium]|jgi:hypothetical protein